MDSNLQSSLNSSSSFVIPKDLVLKTMAVGLFIWAVAWVWITFP